MMKQGNASPELDGKCVNFWVIYISFLIAYITVTVLFHDDFTHFPWTIRTSASSPVAFLFLKSYHRTLFWIRSILKVLFNLFWTFPVALDDKGIIYAPIHVHTPNTPPNYCVVIFRNWTAKKYCAKYFCFVFHRVLIAVSMYMHFIRSLYTNKSFISGWNL